MSQPQRILVRGPNWTGDVVMATPAFRALRQGFPGAQIVLHLRAGLEPLVAGAPWFDEVLPVTSHRKGLRATWQEARRLAIHRFDLGVCLPDSVHSALLMKLAGVRRVVGYRRQGRGPLLDVAVEPPPRWTARERHVLGLVAALGLPGDDTRLELHVCEREAAAADARLAAHRVSPHRPLALLAPGASYGPSKLWPAACFARVGDALAEAGAEVALVGAPSERELARAVASEMRAPVANLAGELTLGSLKAAIRRASLLVCNDAGARHVAVAFGVPCVVLLGPTSLAKTNLNLERVRVLAADVGCRPCYRRECPIDHRCMRRLEPERVIRAALPALDADAASRWRGGTALRAVSAAGEARA
jgi:heptosyltransferase-2